MKVQSYLSFLAPPSNKAITQQTDSWLKAANSKSSSKLEFQQDLYKNLLKDQKEKEKEEEERKDLYVVLSAKAGYYAGGGLDASKITWNVDYNNNSYIPLHFPEGFLTNQNHEQYPAYNHSTKIKHSSLTDETGTHLLNITFSGEKDPPLAININCEATIQDLNNQALVTKQNCVVHPSSLYVGLKIKQFEQDKSTGGGSLITVFVVVTDDEGNMVEGIDCMLSATKQGYTTDAKFEIVQSKGETKEEEDEEDLEDKIEKDKLNPEVKEMMENRKKYAFWEFSIEKVTYSATWSVVAGIRDELGRYNEATTKFIQQYYYPTVYDKSLSLPKELAVDPLIKNVPIEQLILKMDRDEYLPGDKPKVIVEPPFVPCHGVIYVTNSTSLVHFQPFSIDDNTNSNNSNNNTASKNDESKIMIELPRITNEDNTETNSSWFCLWIQVTRLKHNY